VSFNIGIAGATGEVTLRALEERPIPVGNSDCSLRPSSWV